jgi:hypothetical protein
MTRKNAALALWLIFAFALDYGAVGEVNGLRFHVWAMRASSVVAIIALPYIAFFVERNVSAWLLLGIMFDAVACILVSFATPHHSLIFLCELVLVALVGAGGVGWWLYHEDPRSRLQLS